MNEDGTFGRDCPSIPGPHIPVLFDGTAHLTETASTESRPILTQSSTSDQPVEIQTPGVSVSGSENEKIVIIWKVIDKDLDAFKAEVIRGIKSEEDKFLGFFVERQENARNIFWNVVIPFGGAFAGNHKRRLDSVETFKDFLLVAEGTSETRKIVCRLVQKDPKDIAKKQSVYKQLKKNHTDSSADVNDPVFVPSPSAMNTAALSQLLQEIFLVHSPSEEHSGSAETSVYINPENSDEYFLITMRKAYAWAKAIQANSKEVTVLVPPKSPLFQFKNKTDKSEQANPPNYPNNSQPQQANPPNYPNNSQPQPFYPNQNQAMNPYGMMQMPYQLPAMPYGNYSAAFGNPNQADPSSFYPQASTSAVQIPPSESNVIPPSPPPFEDTTDLSDYLKFARVNADSEEINNGLSKLGITHWSMFEVVSADELVTSGVPLIPARCLIRSVKTYPTHLKNLKKARFLPDIE
ncbi:uncharacterized protein PGTG_02434 [Puccinia graminis f. sp. tritici CRL 75-36-700-3]|uniref:Uncharacterized protein n=1 Tax=Puccinia graminis f. sp. tritici (strain CRL 75-36-700-3 / race SCCL) TaxID=418459 RepID=E3JY48_PUCGT|nr:uncharacterized protein PGTG_02434 [Puccinia graminis f. sp. tritici CRL 75-36-700-3]EFP76973.1 hypothetical protein PGTG_02434 [Puccinia graminis f. sp. tritici CRL 75-36-700-3]